MGLPDSKVAAARARLEEAGWEFDATVIRHARRGEWSTEPEITGCIDEPKAR